MSTWSHWTSLSFPPPLPLTHPVISVCVWPVLLSTLATGFGCTCTAWSRWSHRAVMGTVPSLFYRSFSIIYSVSWSLYWYLFSVTIGFFYMLSAAGNPLPNMDPSVIDMVLISLMEERIIDSWCWMSSSPTIKPWFYMYCLLVWLPYRFLLFIGVNSSS
jgi:hypothetical protein